VSAMGEGSIVISSSGGIVSGNGTSFSSPLIACLVIGLRQALPQASAKEIYQRVINSTSQINRPDNLLGYGIPNFTLAKDFLDFSDEFQSYPNPVSDGWLKIIFRDPQNQIFSVTIFNSAGQKVSELSDSISWKNNPYAVDLSTLARGLYLVKVQTPTSTKTIRIVSIN